MSSVPASQTRVWPGVTTVFTISGVTYVAMSTVEWEAGFNIITEYVTGTTDPYLATGGYKGQLRINGLASSDARFEGLAAAISGIVPTFGVTWQGRDQEGIGASGNRTWTMSGKFSNFKVMNDRDNIVKIEAVATLAQYPTVVQS